MYHYCPNCNYIMKEYNVYGQRTLNCRYCGQQIAYGHKDHRKDKERREEPENKQEEHIVECKLCAT